MKKTTFYKIGAFCVAIGGFGLFTAFDDGNMTDEQKIEAAYTLMVEEFNAEQDSLCKVQALVAAQQEWSQMQEGLGGGDEPISSGGYRGGVDNNYDVDDQPTTSGNNTASSGSEDNNDNKDKGGKLSTDSRDNDGKGGKLSTDSRTDNKDGGGKLSVDSKDSKSGGGKLSTGEDRKKSGKLSTGG